MVAAAALGLAACGGSSHPATTTSTTTTTATAPRHTVTSLPPESSAVLSQIDVAYPEGSAAEQTKPTVTPPVAGLKATFTLHLKVSSTLGARGYARRDYEILLKGIRPRCAVWTQLDDGALGSEAAVALPAPIELGWCAGVYRGRVLLQTNPSCPPRTSTTAPPCRTYAPRYAVVGRFTFRTR